ncbi:MAG TPA: glycosyltransferase family 4 protein, partial [Polyangia bacterium]|nr:glycosyltransferase family 4 protein [Polyangia bacterium]
MSARVLQVAYPFAPVAEDAVGGAEVVLARLDAGLCARGVESL